MPKNSIFSVKKIHTDTPDTEEVNESLDTIYKEDGGENMNISKLDKSGGRGFLYYINWAIVVLILGAVGYYGYGYVQENFLAPEEGDFTLSFEVPTAVASGEEVSFDIVYTNDLSVRVHEAELLLQVPDTFVIAETIPGASDDDNRLWKISSIDSGKTEHITITGTV